MDSNVDKASSYVMDMMGKCGGVVVVVVVFGWCDAGTGFWVSLLPILSTTESYNKDEQHNATRK